jgi:acetylornithine aminotransferase
VVFVPYGDSEALKSVITTTTSAVILEPIQGEAGVHPAPPGYLAAARQACDDAGALLIMDEVQTGMGRTGNWFASLAAGVVPDVMTLAKGLGGGLPIGAVVAFGSAADLFVPGDHGSTFGGNPVSCAAALAVIDTIESQGLLEHVGRMGAHLSESILALQHDNIAGVRGLGLLQAVVLQGVTGSAVEAAARAKGFLVNAVAPDAIRLAPPLVITQVEIDEFVQALPQILTEATS